MIGIDTNVLIRYYAQDDELQSARATDLIESLSERDRGHVTLVVLAEVWWVLRGAYSADRSLVREILSGLVDAVEFEVEHADAVRRALRRVDRGADFADALIHERNIDSGCTTTRTFDADAARRAGMELLG